MLHAQLCRRPPERRSLHAQEPEGDGSEQQWAHAQFRPLLHDVIEDLHAGKLSEDEFPFVTQRAQPSTTWTCAACQLLLISGTHADRLTHLDLFALRLQHALVAVLQICVFQVQLLKIQCAMKGKAGCCAPLTCMSSRQAQRQPGCRRKCRCAATAAPWAGR